MTKKVSVIVLSMLMILSSFTCISVSAADVLPANIGSDYVAGAITGNLFTDEKTEGVSQSDAYNGESNVHKNTKLAGESAAIAKGDVGCSNYNTGSGGKMTSNRDVLDPWSVYADADGDGIFTLDNSKMDYTYPLAGIQLKLNSSVTNNKYPTPDHKKNVVVRIPLTMTAGSGNAIVNVARSKKNATGVPSYTHSGKKASDHEYPIEYNGRDQGVTVAENGKTYLNATFLGSTATSDPQYSYTLGMVMGTDAGITVRMEEDEFYIGYEMVYDISVEADNTSIIAGSGATIALSAEVLNQVGIKGTLLQNFTWYALNEDRTAVVDGLIIEEGNEGKATLNIASTVPSGDYDIVAISDDYSQLVKGVTISVVSLANDYVAGEIEGNTFDVENESSMLTPNSTNYVTVDGTNADYWSFTNGVPIGDGVASVNEFMAAGVRVKKEAWDWSNLHVNGQKFIIGAQVKAVEGTPKFTAAFYEENRVGDRPDGFAVTDGVEITSTEYMPVCFPITMTQARNISENMQYSHLVIGMPEDPAGTTSVDKRTFYMKKGSLFIGYEAAYDIILSADTTKWIPGQTEEINIDCDIVNQVGAPGTLNQEVDWYAMNAERNQMVEGIQITDSGLNDGKATVFVDYYKVPAGKYSIVAVSKENGKFVKGIEIEVGYASVLAELDLTKSGNVFTANAKLMTCDSNLEKINAIIVIVALDKYNEVIDYTVQKITNTYSTKNEASTATKTLTATSQVHHVNAFLWEAADVETPGILDTTLKEFSPMKTLEK